MGERVVKNIHFTFRRYEGVWKDGVNAQGTFTWEYGTKDVWEFKDDKV